MKSDALIQTDVMQELTWDPSVTHEHIGVAVADGIVTLSGTVPSYVEKSAAEIAAQRVAGVKAVVETIKVKVPGSHARNDQDIAKAIVDQFRWSVQVPDGVKASVENGWVDLSGEVEWDFQRRAAENAVRGLTGVRGLVNKIAITAKPVQPDEVKSKIEEALMRAAEREARHLTITVHNGSVRLSGKVRSFADLAAVRGAAWSAPGVVFVDDDNVTVAA
jgi:osmotically-inducible protein OsmY